MYLSHQKGAETTWKNVYFETRNYFEGWISEINVNSFKKLKELIIAGQLKIN